MILWMVLVGEFFITWLIAAYFIFVKANGDQHVVDAFVFATAITLWSWGMLG